jgi:hypothetical protein
LDGNGGQDLIEQAKKEADNLLRDLRTEKGMEEKAKREKEEKEKRDNKNEEKNENENNDLEENKNENE